MSRSIGWTTTGVVLLAMAGCGANPSKPRTSGLPTPPPSPSAEISPTDACATRLHDIGGPLLLFYATRHRLPHDLRDLQAEYDVGELICPVSGKPYVYDPEGKLAADGRTRILIYDATPAHSGIRWGLGLVEAEAGVAPVAKVVAVPNQTIRMNPSR